MGKQGSRGRKRRQRDNMINGPQREKKRLKSDTKRGFSGQRREIYATLGDASAIAEDQQAD